MVEPLSPPPSSGGTALLFLDRSIDIEAAFDGLITGDTDVPLGRGDDFGLARSRHALLFAEVNRDCQNRSGDFEFTVLCHDKTPL